MKYLTLLLTLATGEEGRLAMPAWECRAVQSNMEHVWSVGGYVDRDDGVRVVGVECVLPLFSEWIAPAMGDCGDDA